MVLSAGILVHVKSESAFMVRQNDRSHQARIRTPRDRKKHLRTAADYEKPDAYQEDE